MKKIITLLIVVCLLLCACGPTYEVPYAPTTEGTEATGTAADPHNITLEQFDAMTAEEQEAFADTFPSFSDFVQWLRELRGQNGEDDDVVYIDDETIDLGDYTP